MSLTSVGKLLNKVSRFGFKSGICLLIAPVPVHCFSITFVRIPNGRKKGGIYQFLTAVILK